MVPATVSRPLKSFEEFRDLVGAYRLPRVVLTALDLDLFTILGRQAWGVPALAKRLRVSRRGLDILCRNLAAAGLLEKAGAGYRNGSVAATALNASSPQYRGAYLKLLQGHWDDWSTLTRSVRLGKPVEDNDDPDEAEYRRRFTWAMHERSLDVAPKIAGQLNFKGARSLLDLGGGPGTYALAFLAKNPQLHATVCDRAPALDIAREIAARHPAGTRLSYLPLDFMTQPIPGRYDAVWLSNVAHIYSPRDNQRLLRRIADRLTPGGRLLIQDAWLHDRQGLLPQEANLFAVTMLLFTEGGNTYTAREATAWLRRAGFRRIRVLSIKAGAEDWEGGILEASR